MEEDLLQRGVAESRRYRGAESVLLRASSASLRLRVERRLLVL